MAKINPQPKVFKKKKDKMTSWEFREKYGNKTSLRRSSKPTKRSSVTKKTTAYTESRNEAKASIQLWSRLRDSDKNGYCKCITCGVERKYNDRIQGGHFIPAEITATCFDERNINAQCAGCNRFEMHKPMVILTYSKQIDKKYGEGTAEELMLKSKKSVNYDSFHFIAIKQKYDKLTEELLIEKGLK